MTNKKLDFNTFNKIIKNNKSFIIVSHVIPDGDAIGSILAMTLALEKVGKKVYPVIKDKLPEKYSFLPGSERISNNLPEKCDVAICLDCGDEERLGLKDDVKTIADIIVNIDHHKSNSFFGNFNFVDPQASSVGEILYFFIIEFIDIDIANCIYTSIITDTGSIGYSNTNSTCLNVLAKLIEIGVKPDLIRRKVFDTRSLESLKLLKLTLDTLEVLNDGKIACLYITDNIMKKSNAKDEDTDGLINYARDLKGVEVALLFKEREDNTVKVGLRSNEWVDVSIIAESFGGGGHARASGCTLKADLLKSRKMMINAVKKYMVEED